MEISAPGKLILAGEYSVLEGFPALVTTVSRRVTLKTSNRRHFSNLWSFVGKNKIGYFTINSNDFYENNFKLGIGSSAASALCMAAYLNSNNALNIALSGHRNFSLNLGSGIDVVASYYGGLIEFQLDQPVQIITNIFLNNIKFFCVFLGISQDTRFFLDSVLKFRLNNFRYYINLLENLGKLTHVWKNFYTIGLDILTLRKLVNENNNILRELGKKSGIHIINEQHECLQRIMSQYGGFSKPSGAGGGDISLCFISSDFFEICRSNLKKEGWTVLDLDYFTQGLLISDNLN